MMTKWMVATLVLCAFFNLAQAQEDSSMDTDFTDAAALVRGRPYALTYGGSHIPADSKSSQVHQHRFGISTPISKDETDSYSVALQASTLQFGDEITLSKSGTRLAQTFNSMDVSVHYKHTMPGFKQMGLRFSVGSASDQLFEKSDDNTYTLTGSYSFPSESGQGFWSWFVFVSNNNPIANYVPIPGVGYFHRTPTFKGIFGFPVTSFQWMPAEKWTYSFAFFGPMVRTEVAYGEQKMLQVFVGASWISQSFIRRNREENKDRLFVTEKKAYLGVRSPFADSFWGELQIGKSFDRSVYEGPGLQQKDRGYFDMEESRFVALNLRAIF